MGAGLRGSHLYQCQFSVRSSQCSAEKVDRHLVTLQRQLGVVAVAFIAHKRMLPVDLDPTELTIRVSQCLVDGGAGFIRNVWILAPPDQQQLPLNLSGPGQGLVGVRGGQSVGVQVRGGSRRLSGPD